MARINENFLKLQKSYLFADIAKKVSVYKADNPKAKVISLGIGDVTQPLAPVVVEAMRKAVEDLAKKETFHGYDPEEGYLWLREAIVRHDYQARNIELEPSEVFVNDGAKSDTGNITELIDWTDSMAVTDPIYPVYIDSNVMNGRAGQFIDGKWTKVTYLPCNVQNNFVPQIPDHRIDMVYLCYPNNPTGMVITHDELKLWVDYARKNDAIILYDSAYEAYIQDENIPHSIYEIPGAKEVAIEFRSYSKTAGFTGVRCGYTVIPKELKVRNAKGDRIALAPYWDRRQCTKFNGTSYISQRAAEAIYTTEGREQIQQTIAYYMENAKLMREVLVDLGLTVYGGQNAPYLWVKTPMNKSSWSFFEEMLYSAQVVCTPGVGFGPSGEGFVRLTSFGERNDCIEAMKRLQIWLRDKV